MAVVNKRTLVDSGTRHVVMFEINNATNDGVQVVDASALRGHASNPTLDIRSIKWNTTAAVRVDTGSSKAMATEVTIYNAPTPPFVYDHTRVGDFRCIC